MAIAEIKLECGRPLVVGSFAKHSDLTLASAASTAAACDLVEVRLDLLAAEAAGPQATPPWQHLRELPILFTARRSDEGGALDLDAAGRSDLLAPVFDDAALVDIEVASIDEMQPVLAELARRSIPWVASFHDFDSLPDGAAMAAAAARARDAGAAAFKLAARIHSPADMARLADFQSAGHGLPVATMGMGPLAPVSRLLCAQCGSVLNYGFIGDTPTAPGQWDAASLKRAVARLAPPD